MCHRWDTRGAAYTKLKNGNVVALSVTQGRTTKGLTTNDGLDRMMSLYPRTRQTATHYIGYAPGGWSVYSTPNKSGWIDLYVPFGNSSALTSLATRAKSVKAPVAWPTDGC